MTDFPQVPGVPGLRFRRVGGEEDFKAMSAVGQRSWDADGVEWVVTPEDIAHRFATEKDHDPRDDVLLAEVDGKVIGFSSLEWDTSDEDPKRYRHDVKLLPEWRGKGIREALFQYNETELTRLASEHTQFPRRSISVWANEAPNDWKRIVDSNGYTALWRLLEMAHTDLKGVSETPLPAGIDVRPPRPEEHAKVWALFKECFQDEEWSSSAKWTGEMFEEWHSSPRFMPSMIEAAWSGDLLVGAVESILDEEECASLGKRVGRAEKVCVREDWRGKGIAMALLTRALVRLRSMGAVEVNLDTEAENRSEAWRVYERAGYRVRRTVQFYEKTV
jgi:GNAT superfamily N-acetyltransferase